MLGSSATSIELREAPVHEHHPLNDDEPSSPLAAKTIASQPLERWNYPRSNRGRVLAAFWSLMVLGLGDSGYGAIIPYMRPYYDLSYTLISLVFLTPFVGYTLSAFSNNWIHTHFGQRGAALLCGGCHLVAFIVVSQHPPYPVLVIVYMLAGFGNGIGDAAWNAFVGAMANANELLGLMHAFYGVGGVLGPLIATSMITKLGLGWYAYYYVMIAVSAVELALLVSSFWPVTGRVFREAHPTTTGTGTGKGTSSMHEALWQMPAARVSWLCAAFLLCYVGVEVALGGWIVTFMIKVRQGAAFASGMTATGFWLGLTVGRVFFGFLTPKLGERLALMIYLPAAMGLELLFWLVPQFIVSAVAIALVGFFLGPLFPAVIIAVSKSLPKHLHVSAIGFAAAFGGGGGAVLPFAVGAIAQSKGVAVLQPIVLALLAVQLMLWLALPKFSKKRD
ncbi:MFS general substrate transporter [Cryphonectria parasitica EP155]|uniref:MFS general substrate transporter n=1 Tax=Cryphonectria parasitica (strain ATCC 38755 / EP155) TaxID=660469 RepID=A0A9P4XXC1_CRYP1|nr:MFS general substrate transporter [Cryphonectria parasitica EP155]KAF3762733.1 MFS general substrate transporter [Cryphonectria parasitica EP155]